MRIKRYSLLTSFIVLGLSLATHAQTINTVAGSSSSGYGGDGLSATALTAKMNLPAGVAVDGGGNMYIADAQNHVVRKVTSAGIISTFAGTGGVSGFSGDGLAATLAKLNTPMGVAIDATGNIYISESKNNCVRKVNITTGIISTYAGSPAAPSGLSGDNGPATAAQLWSPVGIAFDAGGNLFIADDSNNRVRTVITSGLIFTFVGTGVPGWAGAGYGGDTGPATGAKLNCPWGVAFDHSGALYISDAGNARIRTVDPSTLKITTYAGSGGVGFFGDLGPAGSAKFNYPTGIALNTAGDLYISDMNNQRVRKVAATSSVISTITGNSTPGFSGDAGVATAAVINNPQGLAVDATGNIYIADANNNRIREITAGPPIKILGDTAVCIGKTTTLTDATTGGKWTSGNTGVATIGSSSGVVTGVAAGTSIITYNSGTNAAYQTVSVTNCKAAVQMTSAEENGLKVYPNPNRGTFSIMLTSAKDEQAIVTITNLIGAKVKDYTISTNAATEIRPEVPSGIYFISALTSDGRWSEKVSIIR